MIRQGQDRHGFRYDQVFRRITEPLGLRKLFFPTAQEDFREGPYLLLENGGYLLLEDKRRIVLQGSSVVTQAPDDYMQFRTSSNFTTSATSPVLIPGLTVTLNPNQIYKFRTGLWFHTSNGFAFQLGGTATIDYVIASYQRIAPVTNTFDFNATCQVFNSVFEHAPNTSSDYFVTFDGTVSCTTGGTFGPMASDDIGAGGPVTITKGSFLEIQ